MITLVAHLVCKVIQRGISIVNASQNKKRPSSRMPAAHLSTVRASVASEPPDVSSVGRGILK